MVTTIFENIYFELLEESFKLFNILKNINKPNQNENYGAKMVILIFGTA